MDRHLSELPNQQKLITLALRGVPLATVLSAIGREGGFGVIVSDVITGELNTDLTKVTILEALQALASQYDLQYTVQNGHTLMVYNRTSDSGVELQRSHSDIIPLQHANASVIARLLNSTIFQQQPSAAASSSSGSSSFNGGSPNSNSSSDDGPQGPPTGPRITADFRTNSIIVVGRESDVELAKEYAHILDKPRERKTWRLSHSDALDVASLLSSGLFNEGTPALILSGSGGSSGGSGGGGASSGGGSSGGGNTGIGRLPSTLRVRSESIEEGTGSASATPGQDLDSASGNSTTLRATVKQQSTVSIMPTGVLIVPDTRLNTLTLLGTATQLAMAEKMMASLDQPAPQVVIETTLLEVSEGSAKELGFNMGLDQGTFQTSQNNVPSTGSFGGTTPFTQAVGLANSATNPFEALFRYATRRDYGSSYNFYYQINALIRNNRAKILANPNLITMHDEEAVISIVDEIIKSVTVTLDSASSAVIGSTTNIGEVGVTLSVLPKVGANGFINLRIHPSLSTVSSVQEDSQGNVVTLLSKREAIGQNIKLRDGETLVMGGLIQETDTNSVSKYPFLADLPILGALARNSTRSRQRTELLVLLTPHIVTNDTTAPTPGPGSLPGIQTPKVISSTLGGVGSGGFAYVAQPLMEVSEQSDADIPDIIANPINTSQQRQLLGGTPAQASPTASPASNSGWQKRQYTP
jgi:type II secretory pathway component GspD/PulD (secretin)